MHPEEHLPGQPASDTRHYEERNVFGTPTGKVTHAAEGQSLPAAPRGFSWRLVRPEGIVTLTSD
jgi:hypothetical protein